MMTVEIKINNVPVDKIDIVNKSHIAGESYSYDITHYDYLAKAMSKCKCTHDRSKGRLDLTEIVAKALKGE